MAVVTPHWLEEKFLQECLSDEENHKNLQIISFRVTPALSPGSNYCSTLWRVQVDYQEGSDGHIHRTSLVVKEPLEDSSSIKILEKMFTVEISFYKEYFPLASKLLPKDCIAPKTFSSANPDVIVMTDLKFEGFTMADRCELLDFDHCRLYAIAAATLHAMSVAVNKEHPELVESLSHIRMYARNPDDCVVRQHLVNDAMQCLAERVKDIDEFKQYSKILRNSACTLWDSVIDVYRRHDKLNVLLQGDPWTANMMFKYDSTGQVTDIRLLDFQVMSYSSPLNDLVFFIWTSASHEVREDRLEDLYHVYCDTLNQKLEECNCQERLSYEELKKSVDYLRPLAFLATVFFCPIFVFESGLDLDSIAHESRDESANLMDVYYNTHYCERHLPRILKQLQVYGCFETLETMGRNKSRGR